MPRQLQNLTFISLAFISLITILIQNACKKDEVSLSPVEIEFISKVQGDWTVAEFNHALFYLFWGGQDTVCALTYTDQDAIYEYYSIDDSIVCTLPYIENIQTWTITEKNNNLLLETQDLCGNFNNYNIYFNNIRYHEESYLWIFHIYAGYTAEMKLVNQDTVITTSISTNDTITQMEFWKQDGDEANFFILSHSP